MKQTAKHEVKMEEWTILQNTAKPVVVAKVAVRNEKGQFHGATNFRGSVVG